MRNKYQRKERKSNHKFEVVGGQELLVRVPLPIAEVWAEMQAQVEELTGKAGLQILRAILENEVTRRVGPPHRPDPSAGCVRWGKQPGYVVFAGKKSRWNDHGYEPAKVRKWNWRATAVAARRKTATSGAGTHGGRVVHAELSASGRECSRRLWDREEQREPAVRGGQ